MTDTKLTPEREAFEKWLREHADLPLQEYSAWAAWQAALRQSSVAGRELSVEEHEGLAEILYTVRLLLWMLR